MINKFTGRTKNNDKVLSELIKKNVTMQYKWFNLRCLKIINQSIRNQEIEQLKFNEWLNNRIKERIHSIQEEIKQC